MELEGKECVWGGQSSVIVHYKKGKLGSTQSFIACT